MRLGILAKWVLLLAMVPWIVGCSAMVQSAMVGAGKSATADDTGFLKSYQGLEAHQEPPGLPDLSYVSPKVRMGSYHKVLMPDFSSITPDVAKLSGLQVRQYKGIKQELPDQIANTFDGSAFAKVTRTSDRLDPRDMAALKRLNVDAVLFGNIKELVSLGGESKAGLTAIQIEFKLVDVHTGEEVITAIHRSTTDLDKVAMGQVRALNTLLTKAKSMKPGELSAAPMPQVAASASAPLVPVEKAAAQSKGKSGAGKAISHAEFVQRLGKEKLSKFVGVSLQLNLQRGGDGGWDGFIEDVSSLVFFSCPASTRKFEGGALVAKVAKIRSNDNGVFVVLDKCDSVAAK